MHAQGWRLMKSPEASRIITIVIKSQNAVLAAVLLSSVGLWLSPYNLSPAAHELIKSVAIFNGWALLVALLLAIVAIALAWQQCDRGLVLRGHTFRRAAVSLGVTLVWGVVWSLSVGVHSAR